MSFTPTETAIMESLPKTIRESGRRCAVLHEAMEVFGKKSKCIENGRSSRFQEIGEVTHLPNAMSHYWITRLQTELNCNPVVYLTNMKDSVGVRNWEDAYKYEKGRLRGLNDAYDIMMGYRTV